MLVGFHTFAQQCYAKAAAQISDRSQDRFSSRIGA